MLLEKGIPQKRVIIVGCGFLGRAAAQLFSDHGYDVLGIVRTEASAAGSGVQLSSNDQPQAHNFPLIACDVTDPASVNALKKQVPSNALLIYAASSGKGGAEAYAAIYRDGLRRVIEAWQPRNTIFVSSTSVYAQTEGETVTELSPTEPPRETGRILLEAENICLASGGTVARFSGIYGPGRSVLLKKFLEETAIIEEGKSRYINQIHRDDGARALFCLGTADNRLLSKLASADEVQEVDGAQRVSVHEVLERASTDAAPQFAPEVEVRKKSHVSRIYNVTDDTPATQQEVYQWIADYFHKPLPPTGPADLNRKRGWTSKRISNKKLRSLGWKPYFTSYQEALPTLQ